MKKLWIKEDGSFQRLKSEQIEGLEEAQLKAYQDDLANYLDSESEALKAKIKELETKEGSNKEEIQALKDQLAQIEPEALKIAMKAVKEQGIILAKMQSNSNGGRMTEKQAVEEAMKFYEDLKAAVKGGKDVELSIKADTLTTSVSNFTRGVEDPNVARLAHRRLTAYDAIPSKPKVGANMGGTYRYLDQDSGTSVRAAAQIAEGAASPESTIAWVKRSIDLKKTSDHLPYSDEFEYDFQDLMIELVEFLRQNVAIEVDDQIINGDGLGNNYDGILTTIPAYTPVASGITDANIFDLICKVSEDITDGEGSKYAPDLVFLNSSDIVSIDFLLKKDANNNYMNLAEMAAQKGFKVIENNSLAANSMILGDSRYAHIVEDGMVTVKTGLKSGTDAIDGISRVLVETRKNLLIKNLEVTGWREVTSISAALTTLAT